MWFRGLICGVRGRVGLWYFSPWKEFVLIQAASVYFLPLKRLGSNDHVTTGANGTRTEKNNIS